MAEDDVNALLAACQTLTERMALVLLAYSGLRRGEMLSLTVQEVAGDLSSIRVNGEGRRQRLVPDMYLLTVKLRRTGEEQTVTSRRMNLSASK